MNCEGDNQSQSQSQLLNLGINWSLGLSISPVPLHSLPSPPDECCFLSDQHLLTFFPIIRRFSMPCCENVVETCLFNFPIYSNVISLISDCKGPMLTFANIFLCFINLLKLVFLASPPSYSTFPLLIIALIFLF